MFKVKPGKSIKTQLLFSFFFIVFLMILIGFTSIYHVRQVYKNGNRIYENNLKTVDYLRNLNINVLKIERCTVDIMEGFDDVSKAENKININKILTENEKLMFDYENLEYTAGEKEKYEECKEVILEFNQLVNEIVTLVDANKIEEAKQVYINELVPVEYKSYKLLAEVTDIATKNAENDNADNYNSYQGVVLAIFITLLLTTVLAAMISFRVSNDFRDKLGVIQKWAKRISEFNVSEDIGELGSDEFGITAKALNDSQFMIRDLVERIMDESTMMSDTGKEVSDAIRKTKKRIEGMNLEVSNLSITENEYVDQVVDIILDDNTSPEFVEKMKTFLEIIEKNSHEHEEFCKELTRMATYMEQIAITSEHQNEIANTHREQVGKFKISAED